MTARYNGSGDDRQTDEFMRPIIVNPEGVVKDNDTLVFIDFRADRMRQIVEALGIKPQFEINDEPKNLVQTNYYPLLLSYILTYFCCSLSLSLSLSLSPLSLSLSLSLPCLSLSIKGCFHHD